MGALTGFVQAAGVKLETSFTPEIDVSAAVSSSGGEGFSVGDVLGPILRPKVTVAGVTYAPYGEPLPLWPLVVGLVLLVAFRKIITPS